MKQIWRSLFLIIPLATLASFAPTTTVKAQITPDNSLGAESSVVNPNAAIKGVPSTQIDGGARRGANLFHSFQEFNVDGGRGAYFSNPAGIQNILSRVTGGNPSNILGTLGVLGNANLFFINPNGIIFGPNARLDVGGSFFASTANSVVFPNGFEFSATDPQAPPLLTVNIPIGLRFRDNPGDITVKGLGHEGFNNGQLVGVSNSFNSPTLEVLPGETLALVGGNVNLDGGVLQSPGGRVELGGLSGAGTVGINSDNSLSFPQGVQLADVSLTNKAGINVIADAFGGGSININARNIGISGQSLLTAGIASNLGTVNNQAGDIKLNATGETRIDQSRVENNVNFGTIADSGNINIQTGSFVLTNGAVLDASNLVPSGGRFAGDVRIDASDSVAIANQSSIRSDGFFGRVFLTSANNSVDISNSSISTPSNDDNLGSNFSLIQIAAPQGSVFLNQATLSSTNSGTGFAGDIVLNARDLVSVTSPDPLGSSGNGRTIQTNGNRGRILIGSETSSPKVVELRGVSLSATNDSIPATVQEPINAGDISIYAQDKILFDQSFIETLSRRPGNAGKVTLQANNGDIFLAKGSTIFSTIEAGGIGDAGAINVTARNFSLTDGAQLLTLVRGPSQDGKQAGVGNAGNINIQASGDVSFAGFTDMALTNKQKGFFSSGVLSQVDSGNSGNAGNISIQARSIFLSDSAQITSQNNSNGLAGDIVLNARDQVSLANSTLSSNGNFGRIFIGKNNVYSDVTSSPKQVNLNGSTLTTTNSSVTGVPDTAINAGNISIDALNSISLVNRSTINASTTRRGNAGDVTLLANNGDISLANGSAIFSTIEAGGIGNAGAINVTARNFSLTDGAQLLTLVRGLSQDDKQAGVGNAGNINIQASGDVLFAGSGNIDAAGNQGFFPSGVRSEVQSGTSGKAGNINIQARSIFLSDSAQITSQNNSNGLAGVINLNALDQVSLKNRSTISSDGELGFIFIGRSNTNTQSPIPSSIDIDNSTLSTTNSGTGFAGDIVLNARDQVSLANNSTLSSNGNFGRIFIGKNNVYSDVTSSPKQVNLNGSTLTTTNSSVTGVPDTPINAGNISIDALDRISLVNGIITAFTTRRGNAGSVTLLANNGEISLADGSAIFSSVERGAIGQGGNIDVTARSLFLSNSAALTTSLTTSTSGLAGNDFRPRAGSIQVNVSDSLVASGGAQLRSDTFGEGDAGNITIKAGNAVSFDGARSTVTSLVGKDEQQGLLGKGNGGTIDITAKSLSLTGGAELLAQTFGNGNAGTINVKTTDSIFLSGVAPFPVLGADPGGFSSGFSNSTEQGANGQGGIINITTPKLQISDGAVLNARSRSDFKGGDITVNANTLEVTRGGQILTTTFNKGDAGSITVKADRINISGSDPTFMSRKRQVAQAFNQALADFTIDPVSSQSGIFANTDPTSQGKGGNLTINTRDLTVQNGATITVSSPQAQAGNLTINAKTIRLDQGSLTAETAITSPNESGANINLQGLDLLFLRNNSLISARAKSDTANGGNITIDAKNGFVIATSGGNNGSDIIADAFRGQGGNIKIDAQSVFGLAQRRAIPGNRTNDIDASSQAGVSGTVSINSPDVDRSRGLIKLPENVVDPRTLISQNPCQQGTGSAFIITGRGGLPSNPNQALTSDNVRVDLVTPASSGGNSASTTVKPSTTSTVKQIVPAQGWVFNDKGQVVLTAYDPTNTGSQRSWQAPVSCAKR